MGLVVEAAGSGEGGVLGHSRGLALSDPEDGVWMEYVRCSHTGVHTHTHTHTAQENCLKVELRFYLLTRGHQSSKSSQVWWWALTHAPSAFQTCASQVTLEQERNTPRKGGSSNSLCLPLVGQDSMLPIWTSATLRGQPGPARLTGFLCRFRVLFQLPEGAPSGPVPFWAM
jgi:hypothetical protein